MKLKLALLLTLLVSGTVLATPIIYIDTFDLTDQFVQIPIVGASSTVTAPEAWGGTRQITITRGSTAGIVGGTAGLSFYQLLSFDQGTSAWGTLTALWHSTTPFDLTQHDGNGFVMSAHSDGGIGGTITVTSASGSSYAAFYINPLAVGTFEDVTLFFNTFSGTANLTQVTDISLVLNGAGHAEVDAAVDWLGIQTPEPASFALLGAGLLGLGMVSRRLRRA